MITLEAYIQGLAPVYKNLTILLTLFILFSFAVYVSYILNTEKNLPIYLSGNSFNDFLNNSNLPQIKSSTVINNITVSEINSLGTFSDLDFCPTKQCSVNLTTGVKICPSTTNNGDVNSTGVTYSKGVQVCVDADKCPPELPYAIRSDGSARNSVCSENENCYCTSNPQCADKVVKYFSNESPGTPGGLLLDQLNYSFATTGVKENNNVRNNIILNNNNLNNEYCQLNPSFTYRIINGCNFENSYSDSMFCKNTSIYSEKQIPATENLTFKVLDYLETIAYFKPNLINLDGSETYSKGNNFLGVNVTSNDKSNILISEVKELFNSNGTVSINGTSIAYTNAEYKSNYILLDNVSVGGKAGLDISYTTTDIVNIHEKILTNCLDSANEDVNYKNMLVCVQDFNQPCTEGVLAYNVDAVNSRNFCQGSGSTLGTARGISNYYLIQPAYFTLSCVVGSGCGEAIDTDYCFDDKDCTRAFENKINKLFPRADYSALTNRFVVEPSIFGVSFKPIIDVETGNDKNFSITNNFIPLEIGDFWEMNNNVSGIFSTSNSLKGTSIINVNNSLKLKKGMSINLIKSYTINSIIGTSVYLDTNLTELVNAGFEIFSYNENNFFGKISNVKKYYNKQTFNLLDLNDNYINNSQIDIKNNYIIFYKQFGFNGLNYNTKYNFPHTTNRVFNQDYYYKNYKTDISPPFTIYELLNNTKKTGLLNSQANFKQDFSMYYPVFNKDYFQQECVYCSPSLNAITFINSSGKLKGIDIQFSGQDYFHYGYGTISGTSNYYQTYFGLTSLNNESNCISIQLDQPISGLQVGDYIIDQGGKFEKTMVSEDTGNSLNKEFYMYDFKIINSVDTPDDVYSPYKLNGRLFPPNGGTGENYSFKFNSSQLNFIQNVYFGKIYYEKNDTTFKINYIRPSIRITKISSDGKIIFTDSTNLISLDPKSIIQFISARNTLNIGVDLDPNAILNSGGAGGAIVAIESITQGRITSIKIKKEGSNYNEESSPFINVNSYFPDTSLLNISV